MTTEKRDTKRITGVRRELLAWYARSRRDLPWRRTRDPYAIWVSEVMLQQTRVAVVVERYQAFLARFPTLPSLAEAAEQEVLALWSGLGYYRRARMLHKAAQVVARDYGGMMPTTSKELRLLPGIGAYTAAAIASIAHDEAVAVVDGNVERVLCRMAGWEESGRAGRADLKRKIEDFAAELLHPDEPGDWNQALMALGATVCLPRNPQCMTCPLIEDCATRGEHKTLPRARMQSREAAYALCVRNGVGTGTEMEDEEVLLEQRPASLTVMPGLWELPELADPAFPEKELRLMVRHAIMQVNYSVRIRFVRIGAAMEGDLPTFSARGGERRWVGISEAGKMALTGLARKVLNRALLLPREKAAMGE